MRGVSLRSASLAPLVVFAAAVGMADELAAADPASVRIGVAAFESSGPPGVELPDIATLLADRIGTRGVGRVVALARARHVAERY